MGLLFCLISSEHSINHTAGKVKTKNDYSCLLNWV